MIHHNVCPLCKSHEISLFIKCNDHLISGEVFELLRCSSCSFVFTQNYPEESESDKYYESEEYISHSEKQKTIFEKIYRLVRKIMLYRKKSFVSRMCNLSDGTILDIGSGTGYFLNTMSDAGWKTTGIEINKKARDYSLSAFNLSVLSPQEILSLPAKSFDCITLWHTLEHFHEPYKYFEEIKRLLKPEGVVIIALPNIDSYDAGYYASEWAAYDVPRHLWHFNSSTFPVFAEQNGFLVSSRSYLPFDVFYVSILSEKYRGTRFASASGITKGLVFSLSSYFRKSKSSSIIYVLRNSGT